MMNLSFCSLLLLASTTEAFLRPLTIRAGATPLFQSTETAQAGKAGGVSGELGIPCEDECAMMSYPNLPASVHPGVLSGQAMMDLLQHAKENGKCQRFSFLCHVKIDRIPSAPKGVPKERLHDILYEMCR